MPATRTTRLKSPTPPAGLVAALSMVTQQGATPRASLLTAQEVYPHALRVIDILHGRTKLSEHQSLALEHELARGAITVHHGVTFTDEEIAENSNLRSTASFDIGFAVCWLLMTAINGKDGAR